MKKMLVDRGRGAGGNAQWDFLVFGHNEHQASITLF
jgi:hypothetical protein